MKQIKELREKDPVKYSVRTLARLFHVAHQTVSQIAPVPYCSHLISLII